MADSELNINYENVLVDLRAKRDKLNAAIIGIETMLGMAPFPQGNSDTPAAIQVIQEVQFDTFFGLSIPDAARKLLGMRKRALSTQEITAALEAGGIKHQSEAFGNTVGSVLNRLDRSDSGVVKVGRAQWGMASWYPNPKRKRNGGKSEQEKDDTGTGEEENDAVTD